MTGPISTSSCLKCEKIFSLADQLSKSMHEFEIFIMEMQFDPKSATSKSREVLSSFWHLISTIHSFKVGEKSVAEKDSGNHGNLPSCSAEKRQDHVENIEIKHESENESVQSDAESDSESESKSRLTRKRRKRANLQQPKPNQTKIPIPNPDMTAKRFNEGGRVKELLRTIKCETDEGFYNLFECLKCQRQFNDKCSIRRHIKNIHLKWGNCCPNCKVKYFNQTNFNLHIQQCRKKKQLEQINVWLKNDRKKQVKVHLHPHQKPKQQANFIRNRRRNQSRSSRRKIPNPNQSQKQRNVFDPLKIKVRNPFEGFSLQKTVNVKVVIERLKMETIKEEKSCISQIQISEEINDQKPIETSLSQVVKLESQ